MPVLRPNAVGISLCRMIIVEEETRNVTLANILHKIEFGVFPTGPVSLEAYAVLTDGLGKITLNLVVTRCATLEVVYSRDRQVSFRSPLLSVGVHWMVRSCSFPHPGAYEFSLQANGEMITQAVLQVLQKGDSHG